MQPLSACFLLVATAYSFGLKVSCKFRRKDGNLASLPPSTYHIMDAQPSDLVSETSKLSLDNIQEEAHCGLRTSGHASHDPKVVKEEVLPKILDFLKSVLPNYNAPLYVGSAYEGWNVGDIVEYDVVLVCNDNDLTASKSDSGYWTLHRNGDDTQLMKSERKVQDLIGLLGKATKALKSDGISFDFQSKQRLGCVTHEVKKDGEKIVTFKFIPGYRLKNSELFLPSFAQKEKEKGKWIKAFPEKEKKLLKKEGCLKDVLRQVKALRNRETCLQKLTSYHLKTAVLHELSKDSLGWEHSDLAARKLGVLEQLINFLKRSSIPYFHDKNLNIFQEVAKSEARQNMVNRLKAIVKKDREGNQNPGSSSSGAKDAVDGQDNRELLDLLRKYFAAKVPASRGFAEGQKRLMQDVVPLIKNRLKEEKFVQDIRYTGSAYEGVNLKSTSDYDLMVVIDGSKETVQVHHQVPSFAVLKTDNLFMKEHFCVADGLIKPAKVMSYFMGLVRRVLNTIKRDPKFGIALEMTPREHGPAIEIEIKEGEDQIFMDITPAFMLSPDVRYIAKTLKPSQMAGAMLAGYDPKMFWRQSFSFEEVQLLKSADNDGGCRKMVLRITKALRKDVGTLAKLSSYHLKTLMMHTMKDSVLKWSKEDLANRFLDFLRRLEESLERKFIEHYFVSGFNLYQGIGDVTFANMRNKVRRIRTNPNEQRKLLTVDNIA